MTSPFTFFATAGAIHRAGARPVFVDIDPASMNLDPGKIEHAITPKTRAILPVHLFGQCADMEPLWRIAVRHGISIIEDAAQSIGAEYHGRRAGVLGEIGCFSFFPTKNLGGAGDGGMLTTDDHDLGQRLRRLRVARRPGGYRHGEIGLNSRLDALQAAILHVKLAHLEEWTEARRANAKRYEDLFAQYGLLDLVTLPASCRDCGTSTINSRSASNRGQRDAVAGGPAAKSRSAPRFIIRFRFTCRIASASSATSSAICRRPRRPRPRYCRSPSLPNWVPSGRRLWFAAWPAQLGRLAEGENAFRRVA